MSGDIPTLPYVDEYFEKHGDEIKIWKAQRSIFQPKPNALLGAWWKKENIVPCDELTAVADGFLSNELPNFLLEGLGDERFENSQPEAYDYISRAQFVTPSFMYGVSGAGKTRTVFEHLSRQKGIYLLSADLQRNSGSQDFLYVTEASTLQSTRSTQTDQHNAEVNKENRRQICDKLVLIILIRRVIHDKLEQLFGSLSAFDWLLYQLYPVELLGEDLFAETYVRNQGQSVQVQSTFWYVQNKPKWSVFVDEAQALCKIGMDCFTNKRGTQPRSFFSAVLAALSNVSVKRFDLCVHYPVFTGTGLSSNQLEEESASYTVKKPANVEIQSFFADFKLLTVENVKAYLHRFLDLSVEGSQVSEDVIQHVAMWLRGRPRLTASFLEVYTCRASRADYVTQEWKTKTTREFSPADSAFLEALDRYIYSLTRNQNGRKSWSPGKKSLYGTFEAFDAKVKSGEIDKGVQNTLQEAIFRSVVGDGPCIFLKEDERTLIEVGLAAVKTTDKEGKVVAGYIEEPIAIEAGRHFFDMTGYLRDTLRSQTPDGLGQAFEKLLLPGLMMEKNKFEDFVQSNLGENASSLKDYTISRKSAYGVLCVDTSRPDDTESGQQVGERFKQTMDWIEKSLDARFEGQVAPFCSPDNYIGPDIMFLLRQDNFSIFLSSILQSKYEAYVSNQQKALRTLCPDMLYCTNRGKPEKMYTILSRSELERFTGLVERMIAKKPCLRILVQIPAEPTSAASNGLVARSETSPSAKSVSPKIDPMILVTTENMEELFDDTTSQVIKLLKKKRQRFAHARGEDEPGTKSARMNNN